MQVLVSSNRFFTQDFLYDFCFVQESSSYFKPSGARRLASRRVARNRGTTEMPYLSPGRYPAVIDSITAEAIFDIEMGDLWVIDKKNNRHLHYGYIGIGGGITLGGSVSRQYGALDVSSSGGIEGFALSLEVDGTSGLGGAATVQMVNQSLDKPSVFGGIAIGLEAGFSAIGTYTWFKKSYESDDSPLGGIIP